MSMSETTASSTRSTQRMFGELCGCGQHEPGISYAVELDKETLIISVVSIFERSY